jgi:hypothetical protein
VEVAIMRERSFFVAVLVVFAVFSLFDPPLLAADFDFKLLASCPIHSNWYLPYGHDHYNTFPDIVSCGFDGGHAIDFTGQDLESISGMGFDYKVRFGGWYWKWLRGSSFYFEADGYDWRDPGRAMPGDTCFFDTGNLSGTDKEDPDAYNTYARYAEQGTDSAGYILANLRTNPWAKTHDCWDYSKWFSTERVIRPTVDTMLYYARFRVKGPANPDSIELRLEVGLHGGPIDDTFIVVADTVDPSDFQNPGSYEYFELSYVKRGHHEGGLDTIGTRTDFRVWWNGKDEVYVDRVDVYDEFGYECLKLHGYDDSAAVYMDSLSSDSNFVSWFLRDEPRPWQINVQKYWLNFIDSFYIANGSYDRRFGDHAYAKAFNYWVDYYAHECSLSHYLLTYYSAPGWFADTVSGPESDTTKLQHGFWKLIQYIEERRPLAKQNNALLGYYVKCTEIFYSDGSKQWRYPTPFEQEAVTWLPFTHGVNYIYYYRYNSRYTVCDEEPPAWQCPKAPADTLPWVTHDTDRNKDWGAFERAVVYYDPTAGSIENRDWIKIMPRWSVLRRVNKQLQKIGHILIDPDAWESGFTCYNLGSYFTSFKSDKFDIDSAFVEIATFEQADTSYFLLLNRRCLSTEGQNVTVELSGDYFSGNQYYIIGLDSIVTEDSVYFAFIDTTYSAKLNEKIPFSTYLAPGQGKFFKIIVAARKS